MPGCSNFTSVVGLIGPLSFVRERIPRYSIDSRSVAYCLQRLCILVIKAYSKNLLLISFREAAVSQGPNFACSIVCSEKDFGYAGASRLCTIGQV